MNRITTEKRLIEANALMKAIKSFRWFGVPNTLKLMFDYLNIIINEQPTVDAVEVVRCKDCRHRAVGDDICFHPARVCDGLIAMKENDYCSYGERIDND